MTSVLGHIMNYDFPNAYSKWEETPFAALLDAPLDKLLTKDGKDIKRNLDEQARRADWLIIWTDCDREGENIGYEIMEICRAVNRRINVFRARFSVVNARYGLDPTFGALNQSPPIFVTRLTEL